VCLLASFRMFSLDKTHISYLNNDVPTFVVDASGGGGKIIIQPNYILSQSPTKTVLRNFEGVITTYPEPEQNTPGLADDYLKGIYPDMEEKRSDIGIAGLMNDKQFNLVPEGMKRMNRREKYVNYPEHVSLENQREKRDQLKEKKFQAQQKKSTSSKKGDE
jgi:lysine 2,3-aminomutase